MRCDIAIWLKVLIGGGIGLVIGGVLGYFGKCSSGTCPLTANPYRGAMLGALVGVLIALTLGRAGQTSADGVPHLRTAAEFDENVLEATSPILVDFYSDRCAPCRRLAPTIRKLMTEYKGKVGVFKVNVDESAELARRYEITSIPAVILFDKGKVAKRWVGLRDESEYRSALDSAVAKQERSLE